VNYVVACASPARPEAMWRLAPPRGPTILAYTQVPSQFARLKRLAQEVAGDLPTVLDRALAIERYLRENHEYSLTLSPYRRGATRDPIEAFLFEHRFGHCELFASAMVLMCRAVGVPARLTEGFAGGECRGGRLCDRAREGRPRLGRGLSTASAGHALDPTGFPRRDDGGDGLARRLGRLCRPARLPSTAS
jgi:transglutaminase-like putative cysteine protease